MTTSTVTIAILLGILTAYSGYFIVLAVYTILCELLDILGNRCGDQSNGNGGNDNVD